MEGHGWHLRYHNPSEGIGDGAVDSRNVEYHGIVGTLFDLYLQIALELLGVEWLVLVEVAVGVHNAFLVELYLLFGFLHQQYL